MTFRGPKPALTVPALLSFALAAVPAKAEQFVVTDLTYTATKDNTNDSHFRVPPLAGAPKNWRSPIDYASGKAYVRLEVISKPSDRNTLYNICYEGNPTAACMGYSPPYTKPGLVEFAGDFSSFWQYSAVDWSKGVNQVALILKDENGTKVQGDPAFYPTTIHVTITIVAKGSTYIPPSTGEADAGSDAATVVPPRRDAGAAGSQGAGGASNAGGAVATGGTTAAPGSGSGGTASPAPSTEGSSAPPPPNAEPPSYAGAPAAMMTPPGSAPSDPAAPVQAANAPQAADGTSCSLGQPRGTRSTNLGSLLIALAACAAGWRRRTS